MRIETGLQRASCECAFSTHCTFGAAQLEEALRDRLVCGLCNEAIQRKLLSVPELTFANALKTAQGMEAAELNAQQLKGPDSVSIHLLLLVTLVCRLRTCV